MVHPCKFWFEWHGSGGYVFFYDKVKEEKVKCPQGFSFLFLDQVSVIGGWHEQSKSGIVSNEVRDSRIEPMHVRSFKGGPIAEGLYSAIKDRVNARGGYFCSSIYLAVKTKPGLAIGNLRLAGAALNAWVDFSKDNRADMNTKSVKITGVTKGKKGNIEFVTPIFGLIDCDDATNKEAVKLDLTLQEYLKAYFARQVGPVAQKSAESAAHEQKDAPDDQNQEEPYPEEPPPTVKVEEDDSVPF